MTVARHRPVRDQRGLRRRSRSRPCATSEIDPASGERERRRDRARPPARRDRRDADRHAARRARASGQGRRARHHVHRRRDIGASGLRNSWASMARKCRVWRPASSSASSRLRSDMSRVTLANPRRRPSASCRAVTTVLAQNRDPSLRTRQPSPSTSPCRIAVASSRAGLSSA